MYHMIMLVLEEGEKLQPLLEAWRQHNVREITFYESTCAYPSEVRRPHIPVRFMFGQPDDTGQVCTITVFAIVPDEQALEACIASAEELLNEFEAAGTALCAWPLTAVRGFGSKEA